MGYFLAQRWRQQPQGPVQVDWSNSLVRGADTVYLGSLHRFVAASGAATALPSSGATWLSSRHGISPSITSADRNAYADTVVPSSGWTVAAIIAPASTELWARYVGHASTNRGVDDRAIVTNGSGNWTAYAYDQTAGTSRNASSSVQATAGRADIVIAWFDPMTMEVCCAANTPASVGSVATLAGGVTGYGTTPQFCVGNASVLSHGAICVPLALKVNRTWSAAERATFYEHPWQCLRPLRPIIYSLPTTGPTVPTLSLPGVIDITSTSARPQVTITYN